MRVEGGLKWLKMRLLPGFDILPLRNPTEFRFLFDMHNVSDRRQSTDVDALDIMAIALEPGKNGIKETS